MKKKKLAILTDHSLSFTGFGRFSKALLTYLYSLNKYDLVHFAVGAVKDNPDLTRTPWVTRGVVDPNIIQQLKAANPPQVHEQIDRMSGYGAHTIDTLVKEEKCDVLLNVQDIWGISFACDYHWSDKITNVLWTTLDSRPILQQAIDCSKKVKHFWSWADFATQDMIKMGLTHVKTVRGCIDTSRFYPLTDSSKSFIV